MSVGGGRHTLHPITLVSVQGPWRVPLEFTLHYSDTNEWAPTLHSEGLGGLSVIEDNAYLARGWTHTLSEAIVGIKTDLPATDSSWSPNTFPWTTGNPCQAAERVTGKRLLYRHPEGGYDEFGFATSGTGGDSCAVDGGNILLSSRRGTPYRLRVINFASSTREFELTDLRTGIVTKFDRHGRILSKKARTGPGASAWFGWTVQYNMMDSVDARRRRIVSIDHDSGHRIMWTDHGGPSPRNFVRQLALQFNSTTREVARFNWNPATSAYSQAQRESLKLDSIFLSATATQWLFEYATTTMGAPTGVPIPNRMTRATNPAGVRVYDGELSPRAHGNWGAYAARTLAFDDAEGGWEFRRRGYAQVQHTNSAGAQQGPNNPCSTAGTPNSIAVIDRRARKLDSSGNPISCTVDSDCGVGSAFLCTQRAYPGGSTRYCARYICQATTASDSPDEPSQLSETCGCNTSSLLWASVPSSGPNQVRRIQRRTSSTGVKTSYEHDAQGRIIAQCTGDDDDVVSRGTGSSCPATGQLEEWWYDSEIPSYAGVTPWAVREYRRTSVRGNSVAPYSRVWTRDTTTGRVTSDVETAWTYSYATWTWDTQTRTTTYSFVGSPHDGWTERVGPGDGSASDPVQTAEYWPISSTSTTSGQVHFSRWRRERPGGAAPDLQREYSAHSIYGVAGTELDEHGITTNTTFDDGGRARTMTTPLGTTRIAYDSLGRMLSMRRPSGQATVYEYTAGFERPYRIVTTDSPTVNGAAEATAATSGAVMEDTVDPYAVHIARLFRSRVSGVHQPEWMRTMQHLDDHGRVARDENTATGGFTTRTYDNFGELLESTDARRRAHALHP